ncbi:hypothetical protein R3P38DRAFT_2766805 [Favolaschia claudopus]|uniref:Uncharacterized protein n=1 Tax=Favolaschia claudopus TaxID=2862362 RepID=A0AAW0D1W8_9AGAR
MDDKRHGHILSIHAMELEFDTFFFYRAPCLIVLLFGANQKLTPMTNSRLNRWLNVLAGDHGPQEVFLCPVEVEDAGPFEYTMKCTGEVIEPDSTAPLATGNYGIFIDRTCELSTAPALRFARKPCNSIPPDIQHIVAMRDDARCVFTGAKTDLATVWVVPPDFGLMTEDVSDGDWDPTSFRRSILGPEGGLQDLLPSHFTPPSQPQHEHSMDYFLRRHFRLCLNVQLRQGDIAEDFSEAEIFETSLELGITYYADGLLNLEDLAPAEDPRWETELGQEIHRDLWARLKPASDNLQAARERKYDMFSNAEIAFDERLLDVGRSRTGNLQGMSSDFWT